MERTFNMLEAPAMRVCPMLAEIAMKAAALAERTVRMSGSGSTLYTAFDTEAEAESFLGRVEAHLGTRACVVRPWDGVT